MRTRVRWQRHWAALVALPLCGLLAGEAAARRETKSAAALKALAAAAQGRLQEGLAALAAHDLTTAAQRLTAVYIEAPTLDGLYALAQLALAEGKTLQAQDLMRRYLADPLLEAAPDSVEYREAERVLALPSPPVAKLEIQGERGTLIQLDGRPVGILPLSGPIVALPGEHTIQIHAGERELREKVRLTAGRFSELRYNLSTGAFIINVLPGALIALTTAGLSAEDTNRLRAALESAVQKERYSALAAPSAPSAGGSKACAPQQDCWRQQARKLQAEYIVTASATRQGADVALALDLLDVEIGVSAASAQLTCPGCTSDGASAKLAALFGPLLKQAVDRPRGKVSVLSDPSGAELTLDGRLVGVTPYEGTAFTGLHKLALQRRRFQGQLAELKVNENQTAQARIMLRDLPDPPPPPPCPPHPPCPACPPPQVATGRLPTWRLITGVLGTTAGVLMIGIGAPAIALQGQCADANPAPGTLCQTQYETLPLGAALVGTGSALAIAGIVLLAYSPKAARNGQPESKRR